MVDGNGATSKPTEFETFLFGEEVIKVPIASLYLLEARKEDFDSMGPQQTRREYIRTCVNIISFMVDEENWETLSLQLWKKLHFKQMGAFVESMNKWLLLSGLIDPGEAEAAMDKGAENLGTGTSTPSLPNLPLMEFSEATSIESSDPIH